MRNFLLILVFLAVPQLVHAGTQTYSTPGTYSFTVPAYGSLTVTVRGAGGGGSSGRPEGLGVTLGTKMCGYAQYINVCIFQAGAAGGYSAFGSGVVAYGGTGAPRGAEYWFSYAIPAVAGSPGSGYGGTVTSGGGAAGGAGGQVSSCYPFGTPMCGASGGTGGRVVTTYSAGSLTPGSALSVVVGSGGAGGAGHGPDGYGVYAPGGSAGSPGSVSITWTAPAVPTCSINASPTTINSGSSSSLSWTSTNSTTFHISNIGYVTPNISSGTTVTPSATITYTGTATGAGGTANCSRTVTVNQSCTFNGSPVTHGSSVTAYQAATVPYGNSCVSQTRTCTSGTLSGTYTNASCSVTPAANCSLNGNTVLHGASQTFYTSQTAPAGGVCSSISQSRTCTNGTLSGTATYQYGTCTCAPVYSCSANNVRYTNSSCVTSTVATCTAPSFCSAGQSACVNPPPSYTAFSAGGDDFTGHLELRPSIVRQGGTIKAYWNVSNVASCSLVGSNGDSWTGTASGSGGRTSSPITARTTYTLTCVALSGVTPSPISETVDALIIPIFQEQ